MSPGQQHRAQTSSGPWPMPTCASQVVYVCMYMYKHTYIQSTHTHTHTYTHTHTHTHWDPCPLNCDESVTESGHICGEKCANLFKDGCSKWSTNKRGGAWVEMSAQIPLVLSGYALKSAGDFPGRDPCSWTIRGYASHARTHTRTRYIHVCKHSNIHTTCMHTGMTRKGECAL